MARIELAAVALLLVASAVASATFFEPFNVTYDQRSLILGGKRRMLISAGIHYPRATPDMWPGLIEKSKEGGADAIETYVFWNGHEPSRGEYYFEGRFDLVKFVKLVGSKGLYFLLRIGPYACAEWNFGGFPVWLRDIPGIEFRTTNQPYKAEMQRFVKKIVDLMRTEMLFSWQGGPIILLQIENEYGNIEILYGDGGKEYVKWAANLATELDAGVPWIMCRQPDAPENIIDSCNAFYCDGFKPNSAQKPMIWTEDWNGWYANWGESLPHRPVEDNAFAVARFFARGGCFHNYYMFFGGTNFGRTAGGPLQITSYDYDAPIDSYGLLHQPKWGHLKDLHAAIKLCEPALVSVTGAPQYKKFGLQQEVHIYSTSIVDTSSSLPENVSICSAFLTNLNERNFKTITVFGQSYTLPPWSVSIMPDCRHVAFNTAKVGYQRSIKTTEYGSFTLLNATESRLISLLSKDSYISEDWTFYNEPIGTWNNRDFIAKGIQEHLNVTKDVSDYLWYITRIDVANVEIANGERNNTIPKLTIGSIRDVIRIFVNGQLAGSKAGHWVPISLPIQLVHGVNELAIVTETVGLQNYGAFLEIDGAGIQGEIKLSGSYTGGMDLSKLSWAYKVGLEGEDKRIYSLQDHEVVRWTNLTHDSLQSGFTWYKAFFDVPTGLDPIAIDLGSMTKGQVWINGHGIGRYWSLHAPKSGCPKVCDYRGAYNEHKCRINCGQLTQRWYHIPRAWLQPSGNLIVLFEEEKGDPFKIALKLHTTQTICSNVPEDHPPPLSIWSHSDFLNGRISVNDVSPEVELNCDAGQVISEVSFASFGNPQGSCGRFTQGACHAPNSLQVVSEACEGKNRCRIVISAKTFGKDPCPELVKTLAVEAKCSSSPTSNTHAWHDSESDCTSPCK